MKKKVIPTVFAETKEEFDKRLKKLVKISRELQIDFMDGIFVEKRGVGLEDIPDLKKFKGNFEAHLMVSSPFEFIEELKEKGFRKVIFHYESLDDDEIPSIIKEIKKNKMSPFIAINPETKPGKIEKYLGKVGGVMFMGVNPGKENQKFILSVYTKIIKFRERNRKVVIQVDGGVNNHNARKLAASGVDIINSGSYISDSKYPKEAFNELKRNFCSKVY